MVRLVLGAIRFHQALSYLWVLCRWFMPLFDLCAAHNAGNAWGKNHVLHRALAKFLLFNLKRAPPKVCSVWHCSTSTGAFTAWSGQESVKCVVRIKRLSKNSKPVSPTSHARVFVIAHIWLQLHKNRRHKDSIRMIMDGARTSTGFHMNVLFGEFSTSFKYFVF